VELLLIALFLASFVIAAGFGAADTRPSIDDEPRRSI
jgi:hypothetical protein